MIFLMLQGRNVIYISARSFVITPEEKLQGRISLFMIFEELMNHLDVTGRSHLKFQLAKKMFFSPESGAYYVKRGDSF